MEEEYSIQLDIWLKQRLSEVVQIEEIAIVKAKLKSHIVTWLYLN